MSDEVSKARRVQEQVQMRLAQKSTLPRQNGVTSNYAMSGKAGLARLVSRLVGVSFCLFCFVFLSLTGRAAFPGRSVFPAPRGGDVSRGGGAEGGSGRKNLPLLVLVLLVHGT